jgi:hypothetical protein
MRSTSIPRWSAIVKLPFRREGMLSSWVPVVDQSHWSSKKFADRNKDINGNIPASLLFLSAMKK